LAALGVYGLSLYPLPKNLNGHLSTLRGVSIVKRPRGVPETTPRHIATALFETFGTFDLDPAAPIGDMHIKAHHRFTNTHDDDGLALPWNHLKVFVNPPFGRGQLRKWLKKIVDEWEARNMQQLVVLTKFGVDSAGYRRIKASGAVVMLDIGQVQFGGYKAPSPWSNGFCLWGVDEPQVAGFSAALKRNGVKHVEQL
jgi:hypothetical protein